MKNFHCKECGHRIPILLEQCPQCAIDRNITAIERFFLALAIGGALALFIIMAIWIRGQQ